MGNHHGLEGASERQRVKLIDHHTLTEEQMVKLEAMFNRASKGTHHIDFKEFLELYPKSSKFQRDDTDLQSVYYAFADAKTNVLKFDGFLSLLLLAGSVGTVEERDKIKALFAVLDPAGNHSIPREDFQRFIGSFMSAKAAALWRKRSEADLASQSSGGDAEGAVPPDDGLMRYEEFKEFCRSERDAYEAICAYVFPM